MDSGSVDRDVSLIRGRFQSFLEEQRGVCECSRDRCRSRLSRVQEARLALLQQSMVLAELIDQDLDAHALQVHAHHEQASTLLERIQTLSTSSTARITDDWSALGTPAPAPRPFFFDICKTHVHESFLVHVSLHAERDVRRLGEACQFAAFPTLTDFIERQLPDAQARGPAVPHPSEDTIRDLQARVAQLEAQCTSQTQQLQQQLHALEHERSRGERLAFEHAAYVREQDAREQEHTRAALNASVSDRDREQLYALWGFHVW
jgi:hypothetical protein